MPKTVGLIPPVPGDKIQLALDVELQKKIMVVRKVKAAIIVTIPQTGEILASISLKSFNSQDFEDGISNIQKYLTDKNNPLFNRVAEGSYPGSLFKLVVATAGFGRKSN